jgi:hypothetical protein
MKAVIATAVVATLLAAPIQAHADGGQVAAGIIGGLAAGAIIGSALRPPVYYAPPPVYVAPAPVYAAPPPACYYTPGAPVWDAYRGIWVRPPVRVCN